MLDRLAPLAHLLRMLVEPALHRLENALMFPSGDPSLLAGGATVLDGAALAGVGPVAAQDKCKRPAAPHSGSPACRNALAPLSSRSSALAARPLCPHSRTPGSPRC